MEREIWNQKHQMDQLFHGDHRHHSSFSSDLNLHPSRPGSLLEHYSLMNPIRIDGLGNRWLCCYFDLRSYKPEEINVTLNCKERCLMVEASHEVKESKEHYVKRNYTRKVPIPDEVKADLSKIIVRSSLSNDGLLCVEAPLPKATIEEMQAKKNALPSNAYQIHVKTI